ncbi:hypothetical protein GC093_30160 [Paenibacillus sp. LMG 31456]|uniref:Transposase n=2 Tax=Paenibacillus foliorum TaxID=2654974 RepID=A0A972H103_9BACL|nr:hypothetical protein [Paenibacillus foliorum]
MTFMGYAKKEKREVRFAYLRMILRLQKKLDEARIALIISVADMYFDPNKEQEESILREFREQYPEEGETLMELMLAWKKWAYEEGIEKGIEKAVLKMLNKGFTPEEVAETLELPMDDIRKLAAKE